MICHSIQTPPFDIEKSFWDDHPWTRIDSQRLSNFMGTRPLHFPDVQVKTAWDEQNLHLMFRVKDRYVCARAKKDQDAVYKDSCVEFFFSPGIDPSLGYFNLEMNCSGKILFHFQKTPRKDSKEISENACRQIKRVHSMPDQVDPEIQGPVTWTAGYSIPFSVLENYCPTDRPSLLQDHTVDWRANFYKCADNSSHPHWLTWAPVDLPTPDFHHPPSLGVLRFNDERSGYLK